MVDHVNDVVQTVVRPTAGGLAFGAGSSSRDRDGRPTRVASSARTSGCRSPSGVLIALCVHGVKAAARPVVNATTAGVGAPVASTAEDFGSVVMSLLAILLPVLVLVGLVLLVCSRSGWSGGGGSAAGRRPIEGCPRPSVCLVDCFRARDRRTRLRPDLVAGLLSGRRVTRAGRCLAPGGGRARRVRAGGGRVDGRAGQRRVARGPALRARPALGRRGGRAAPRRPAGAPADRPRLAASSRACFC